MAAMLHQAFLLGAIYELDMSGRVTGRLFENLNAQFYRSSSEHKFVSLTYGEICEDETFRFLSAAQPFPSVFSNRYDRFMAVNQRLRRSFPPVGLLPSRDITDRSQARTFLGFKERYEMNEWLLMGQGDILLLHTDGVTEHRNAEGDYFPERLEQTLREVKQLPAAGIYGAVMESLLAFGEPTDDISLVVVKRL
jgi:serine phosphatase RsbU (regulator of sigma subunit)